MLLYPAVLGCLVCSKAYGVARAATVPRLMPADLTLVKANSRISLAGIVGAAVSGPLAVGAAYFGGEWSLRYAFLVFAAGTILAILLPAAADASAGEQQVTLTDAKQRFQLPGTIVFALRCNAGLRMLSGFLTMYMAFLLTPAPAARLRGQAHPAAGPGDRRGRARQRRRHRPGQPAAQGQPGRSRSCSRCWSTRRWLLVCAVFYGLLTAVLLGLTAGVAQALGKLSLDSLIQRDVPEHVRTSGFARSETLLQLSWVVGGFIGIALPLVPALGLGVLAALMILWTGFVVLNRPPTAIASG